MKPMEIIMGGMIKIGERGNGMSEGLLHPEKSGDLPGKS
jgi:hypothetical protein